MMTSNILNVLFNTPTAPNTEAEVFEYEPDQEALNLRRCLKAESILSAITIQRNNYKNSLKVAMKGKYELSLRVKELEEELESQLVNLQEGIV